MAPRKRCPVCGSRQWRKEPSSGLITCDEGHVLENYRNETVVVDELGPHTMRKRALKSGRKKKEWQSKADPKLYHGERGKFHYYQCLQLLLRMQIGALIDAWHLPPEFEIVCRDIWALHLSLLPSPPIAEPYLFSQGISTEQSQAAPDKPADEDGSDKHGSDSDNSSVTLTSESSSSDEEDDEMESLLRENSVAASSSESEDEEAHRGQHPETEARKARQLYEYPMANISVLMLACWTLRLPVMYGDFGRLIECYDLPYLDPVRLLPQSLTRHLTKHTILSLSPHFAPTTLQVHTLATRLAKHMYKTYGVMTPEYNAAPLLWRATRALEGTPTLYTLSKKVARTVSLTLTLHYSMSPALKQLKSYDPEHHKYDNAPPEVALVSVVIIVLKLVYGFDGKNRIPLETHDPACALPNFTEYLAAIQSARTREDDGNNSLTNPSLDATTSVQSFDESEMDKYMDFCEKALLPREFQSESNAVLDEFFPIVPRNVPSTGNTANTIPLAPETLHTMPATRVRESSTSARPGQLYCIYNARDVLGSLPEDYEKLLRHAASWAGVDEDYLQGVIERFERRLSRWWEGIRKAEAKNSEEAARSERYAQSGATNVV